MTEPTPLVCMTCHIRTAVWNYEPSDGTKYFCDDCVPRGCSCQRLDYDNEDEDAPQRKDEYGRLLPCVEYWLYVDGVLPSDADV